MGGESTTASPSAGKLRTIYVEGAFSSAMVGLGETYVPAMAIAMGMGEVVAGLIATVPMMVGAVLQLLAPWGIRLVGSYRLWVCGCALLQAISFVPLVIGAACWDLSVAWLFAACIAHWCFGMSIAPAWNTWITALVPATLRTGFFAKRARLANAVLCVSLVVAGSTLHIGLENGNAGVAFAWLFGAAICSRLASLFCLYRHSEPAGLVAGHRAMASRPLLASVRAAGTGRVLLYLIGTNFMVNLAGPFFTPLMMGPLGMSYATLVMMTATAFVARTLVLPCFGRLAHVHGIKPLLWLGAVGIVPIPALWLLSDDFYYLLSLQVLSGVAWAALELSLVLVFFDGLAEHERTRVLSAFNMFAALATGLGAIVGCQLFYMLPDGREAYWWLFTCSTGGRFLMLFVLKTPIVTRLPGFVTLRTVAVRPSAGAIGRPVMATIEEEAAAKSPQLPPPDGSRDLAP